MTQPHDRPDESAKTDTARIEQLVKSDRVVLFMKGTRRAPQCGFSATVVEILDRYLAEYTTVNVLSDPAIREGVKVYASWPTIPQLYVDGEFVGGCDIVREMDAQGELTSTLGDLVQPAKPPSVAISEAAADVFRQALSEDDDTKDAVIRLQIDAGFRHELALDTREGLDARDIRITVAGLELVMDPATARRADGLSIDYVESPSPGFKMENPNAPATVRQIDVAEAKAIVEAEPNARFVDVRTPKERELASIEGTILLTPETFRELMTLPRDTPMVFHCHHGQRSHQAALHFLERGFTRVYNVVGGIDAWSMHIDPSVPRY